jgi:hypothetical protein
MRLGSETIGAERSNGGGLLGGKRALPLPLPPVSSLSIRICEMRPLVVGAKKETCTF